MVQSVLWGIWCNQSIWWIWRRWISTTQFLISPRIQPFATTTVASPSDAINAMVQAMLWRIWYNQCFEEYGAINALRNMVQSIHLVNMEKVTQYHAVPNPAFRYNHRCVTVRCKLQALVQLRHPGGRCRKAMLGVVVRCTDSFNPLLVLTTSWGVTGRVLSTGLFDVAWHPSWIQTCVLMNSS